jgi:putative membrane protein
MTESVTGDSSGLNTATRLAFERTRIAYERTMMAWVRTGTSMITFGFSVYKFFQFELTEKKVAVTLISPRVFGLVLISVGLLALVLGTLEHWRDLRALGQHYPGMPRSVSRGIAALILTLGLFALVAVILRG